MIVKFLAVVGGVGIFMLAVLYAISAYLEHLQRSGVNPFE